MRRFLLLASTPVFVLSAWLILSVTTSFGAVTFDPATGTGFIGRGDVIGNPTLGKAALTTTPTIEYQEQVRVSQVCEKETLRQTVSVTMKRSRTLASEVTYKTRKARGNANITGYLLTGYATEFSPPPTVTCPDSFNPVGSPEITVLQRLLTFSGNGLTGIVWSQP